MINATTIQRLTLMAVIAGLLVGFAGHAHAQQDGVDFSLWPPAVSQTITVAPGNYILQPGIPGCGDQRDTRFADTVTAVSTLVFRNWGWSTFLAAQGGAFTGWFVTQLQQEVANGTSSSIAQFFSDISASPRYATCGTVVLVAPQGYHFAYNAIGIAYDQGVDPTSIAPGALCDDGSDPPYVKCRQGYAAWRIVRYDKYIVAQFVNWSSKTRIAGLSGPMLPDTPPPMFGSPY
jgi:hypothetical protein